MALAVNSCAANARFLKAAVMAGFYPSVLRVQHPPPTYKQARGTACCTCSSARRTFASGARPRHGAGVWRTAYMLPARAARVHAREQVAWPH